MNENKVTSYKDLIVWQKAIELVVLIYSITEEFPKEELYGIISQIRRASISIPSNIAEGNKKTTKKEYRQFLKTAYGSGSEIETLIVISKRLPFGRSLNFSKIDSLLNEIMKILNKIINQLQLKTNY